MGYWGNVGLPPLDNINYVNYFKHSLRHVAFLSEESFSVHSKFVFYWFYDLLWSIAFAESS